jgi:hypothetical protein
MTVYNKDLKERFIRDSNKDEATSRTVWNTFKKISVYEAEVGMDFAGMETSRMQGVIDKTPVIRSSSVTGFFSNLRSYCRWCDVTGAYHGAGERFSHVKIPGVGKMQEQFVSNPVGMKKYLDEIFDPLEMETIDITYRCYMWLIFGGMEPEDAIFVRSEDVNLEKSVAVAPNGSKATLYNESLEAFRLAKTREIFRYRPKKHDSKSYGRIKDIHYRVPGDGLLRGLKGHQALSTIQATLSKRLSNAYKSGKTKTFLIPSHLRLSGVFYRAYELERSGVSPTFREFAEIDYNRKTKNIAESNRVSPDVRLKIIANKEKFLTIDYQRWKLAFMM